MNPISPPRLDRKIRLCLPPPSLPPSLPPSQATWDGTMDGGRGIRPAYFAANRPGEFPFAPRFGVLGPSLLPLSPRPLPPSLLLSQISSLTTCRRASRQTLMWTAVLVSVCFLLSSSPKVLFFLSYHIQLSARSNGRNSRRGGCSCGAKI